MGTITVSETKRMLTLPGDAGADPMAICRPIRSADAGTVGARGGAGTVARLVAAGERNTHEWTTAKAEMMDAFDRAGITAAFMEPEEGGFISGPKNLALGLAAFELAWVDGGAATASLAGFLASRRSMSAEHRNRWPTIKSSRPRLNREIIASPGGEPSR